MAKKETAALAKTSDEETEALALAELSDFFDGVSIDGMEDVGGDDLKLASKIWNMAGLDPSGNAYPRNVLFDTISEKTIEKVEAVLLTTQKSNRWDEYDNDEKKTNVMCQSGDRITGAMADGTQRQCKGCPDTGWFKDDAGKPFRKCGAVHTVVALEQGSNRPFLMRFKKTGLKPFRNYLMQHHWGARLAADGSRKHVPLFAYGMTLSLVMHEGGMYALPVLTRGKMLQRESMMAMHESAKSYVDIMSEVMKTADAQEEKHATTEASADNIVSEDFVE